MRHINIAESVVRKKRDSILLDSTSTSNLLSVIFAIEDSSGVTEILPEDQQDKVPKVLVYASVIYT